MTNQIPVLCRILPNQSIKVIKKPHNYFEAAIYGGMAELLDAPRLGRGG